MTSVAVIMLTYFCANILLGLGLLKRHEDLVAQREKHEQFTRECEERMKKLEYYNSNLASVQKKYEEKQNKVEPIIFPEEFDVTTYGDTDRVLLSIGRDEQGRLMPIRRREKFCSTQDWLKARFDLMSDRDAWKED